MALRQCLRSLTAASAAAVLLLGVPGPVGAVSAMSVASAHPDGARQRLLDTAERVVAEVSPARATGRHLDVVRDPRGDARAPGAASRAAGRHQHGDVLRATYATPRRAGGDVRVALRWAQLRGGRGPGVRRTQQLTMLQHPASGRTWYFWLNNVGGSPKLFASGVGDAADERVRPERLTVRRVLGVGGQTIVRMSAEWLPVGRVRFFTFSRSRDEIDDVDVSLLLDVARP